MLLEVAGLEAAEGSLLVVVVGGIDLLEVQALSCNVALARSIPTRLIVHPVMSRKAKLSSMATGSFAKVGTDAC